MQYTLITPPLSATSTTKSTDTNALNAGTTSTYKGRPPSVSIRKAGKFYWEWSKHTNIPMPSRSICCLYLLAERKLSNLSMCLQSVAALLFLEVRNFKIHIFGMKINKALFFDFLSNLENKAFATWFKI